jgi:hypothetical protein
MGFGNHNSSSQINGSSESELKKLTRLNRCNHQSTPNYMPPVACKREVSRDRYPKSILADKGDVDEYPDNRQAYEKQGDEEYVVEHGSPPHWLAHDSSDSLTGSKCPGRAHFKVVAFTVKCAIVSFASRPHLHMWESKQIKLTERCLFHLSVLRSLLHAPW